jgi:glycine cleavage system H protein
MKSPEELKYTEDHEWINLLDDSIAEIGITEFAQGELGDIVYVEVDSVGETLDQGEVFGTIEAVKTTSDLFMPVSGKVTVFNPELDEEEGDNPSLINSSPFGDGWIVKIELSKPKEIESLMDYQAYKALIG